MQMKIQIMPKCFILPTVSVLPMQGFSVAFFYIPTQKVILCKTLFDSILEFVNIKMHN